MKIISMVLVVSLAGCAGANRQYEQQKYIKSACNGFFTEQKRSNEWLKSCLSGDVETFQQGYETDLTNMPKEKLCDVVLFSYGKPSGQLSASVAQKRKVNCSTIISEGASKAVKSLPAGDMCMVWYARNIHPSYLKHIDSEVKARKLDCVQVVNGIKQTAAMENQAQAAREQAQAARSMAIQNSINANRPVTTNCYRFGNSVNCSSY